jgi:peroxiredoxin
MKTCTAFAFAILLTGMTAFAQQRRPGDLRSNVNLQIGDPAPDFKLKTLDGKREVQLSSFKGRRPVVLVFGSYT